LNPFCLFIFPEQAKKHSFIHKLVTKIAKYHFFLLFFGILLEEFEGNSPSYSPWSHLQTDLQVDHLNVLLAIMLGDKLLEQ
jgi:hypothetical protein